MHPIVHSLRNISPKAENLEEMEKDEVLWGCSFPFASIDFFLLAQEILSSKKLSKRSDQRG